MIILFNKVIWQGALADFFHFEVISLTQFYTQSTLCVPNVILNLSYLQYAPFKPGHKGTHAERARAVGLEAPAQKLLRGQNFALESLINPSKKGKMCLAGFIRLDIEREDLRFIAVMLRK